MFNSIPTRSELIELKKETVCRTPRATRFGDISTDWATFRSILGLRYLTSKPGQFGQLKGPITFGAVFNNFGRFSTNFRRLLARPTGRTAVAL